MPDVGKKIKKAAARALDAIGVTQRRVALIAHGRTGTNYLRELVNTHPDIFFYGEILHPHYYDTGFYEFWRRAVAADDDMLFVGSHIATLLERHLTELTQRRTEQVVGFDLKIPQMQEMPRLHDAIVGGDYRVLHLTRENTLRSVISEEIMYKRIAQGDGQVHRDYTPAPVTVRVDPKQIVARLHNKVRLDDEVRDRYAGRLYFHLTYESIQDASTVRGSLDPVMGFLGVHADDATFQQPLERQNPAPLRRLVENADDLAAELRGTPFEAQLED